MGLERKKEKHFWECKPPILSIVFLFSTIIQWNQPFSRTSSFTYKQYALTSSSLEMQSKEAVHPQSAALLHFPSHISTLISSDVTFQSRVGYDHLFPTNFPYRKSTSGCSVTKFKLTPHWPFQILRVLENTPRLPRKGTSTPQHLQCEPQVNWKTNKWKQKTAAPGPDFLVSFILYWLAYDLMKNGRIWGWIPFSLCW